MSVGPLQALASVREYLSEEILPGVAQNQRGELRAAIKVLDELGAELNEAHSVLTSEAEAMHTMCLQVLQQTENSYSNENLAQDVERLGSALDGKFPSLTDAETQHNEASRCLSACLLDLQQMHVGGELEGAVGELLRNCYAELGRHATRRARWQSVFITQQ